MNNPLSVGVVQMCSSDNVNQNLEQMQKLVLDSLASEPETKLFCFPENCLSISPTGAPVTSFLLTDEPFQRLLELSRSQNIVISLGGVAVKTESGVFNSIVMVEPNKGVTEVYRKIHLFDLELGDVSFKESNSFKAGGQTVVYETLGWKFGLSICYDLRFSELYLELINSGAEALLIPAAFTVPTGRAHWLTLLRARAIEGQSYVLAAAQVGEHFNSLGVKRRQSWGLSCVINPWGEILGQGSCFDDVNRSMVVLCELYKDKVFSTRKKMPMSKHRHL